MYTHPCIKPSCGKKYDSDDAERYYCPDCATANQLLAQQIDAKIASTPRRETRSALQEYDNAPKGPGGFMILK